MALKFLNKKGWHTGSLRNIENVWKAEQKHEAEQRKLDELRKQIHEEKERQEFRLLQEQAGLVPYVLFLYCCWIMYLIRNLRVSSSIYVWIDGDSKRCVD